MITALLKNNPVFQKLQEKAGLDNKKIALLMLALFAIVILLDFRFLIGKQVHSIGTLNPKITKLQKDTASINTDLAKIKDLKSRQGGMIKSAVSKAKKILSRDEIAFILQQISDAANKNEISIVQMKPLNEKVSAAEKLAPLLINLNLVCDYHCLGKFINDLENGEVFLEAQSIKISSQPQDILKQAVAITLKTYVKK